MKKILAVLLTCGSLFAALAARAQPAPDAAMLQPVQRWIDVYNSGTGALPEDIFADDVVITDEYPPYVWRGKAGEHAWASAIDNFIKPGKQHVSIGAPQSFEPTRDGTRVRFVLPATLTFTSSRTGKEETERALWLFVLVKSANTWKITADTWTPESMQMGSLPAPVRNERGVLLLTASLDGAGPLLFTFDPGASDLYTSYARQRLNGRAPQTVCLSSACFPAAMEYFDGDPAQLFPRHDRSLGAIAGSIGPSLLQHYVARLDYRASTLTLIPPAQFQPPRGAQPLTIGTDSSGMPAVAAAIDGKPALFELDLRAPRSMLFAPYLQRTGLRCSHENSRGPYAVPTLKISGTEVQGAAFRCSTASSGKFAASDVAGLLGNNILSHFVVTLDLPHRRAYLERART
jgi:hypothetical protein